MSGSGIRIDSLKMHYEVGGRTIRAVDGLDLEVPEGQLLMVRGRSGSGKSTLLHLIAGLQKPTGGSVHVGDTDIRSLSPADCDVFRRRHIGLVFQFFNLIPSLNVEMNVALPLQLDGQRLSKLRGRIGELLDELGIADRRDHAPHELSGGEMQRVAIARALIVEPRLILADEPTGNLDTQTARDVFGLLHEQVRGRGVTAIVMTHEMEYMSYGDRLIELSDGRVSNDSGLLAGAGAEAV